MPYFSELVSDICSLSMTMTVAAIVNVKMLYNKVFKMYLRSETDFINVTVK